MIITLSPSKGQDFTSAAPSMSHTTPVCLAQSQLLIDEMRRYSSGQIREMMHVSDNIANLNVDRFQTFNTPFTLANAKQALFAFKGDVYGGIDADNYSETDLQFAQQHIRILSGLYGHLRPLDLIQPYRLEMKTKVKNPRGDNLYQFWGSRITKLLNQDLAEQVEPTMVNLASNEYFKSVKIKELKGRLLQINFKEVKDDKARVIAIFAKRARGLMANFVVKNQLENSEDLKAFTESAYAFNAALSDEKQWTFTRPQPQKKA